MTEDIYSQSHVEVGGTAYMLARRGAGGQKALIVRGDVRDFAGEWQGEAFVCPLTPGNAATLRSRLPWLQPVLLGLQTSFGFGDRLGLATPGHVRALRAISHIPPAHPPLHPPAPIFAQQSVRENTRTGRTPQQVLDDATWGVFQEGWREPWGADADHLKTPEAADAFIAAGYTLYTVDPGDHVDNSAHTAAPAEVMAKVEALPWDTLEDTVQDLRRRYLGRPCDLADLAVAFDEETLLRAAAKYGRAVAHTTQMYRYLAGRIPRALPSGEPGFELEVSVDETETPTSPAEHLYIANELERLGVRWVSLAPRFAGRFEKGVDYIGPSASRTCSAGDLATFRAELARHAAIARALGPYKLSIHSGSDKFSIYPIVAELAGGLVHLKTAGTSYLQAVRTVAEVDPAFFREILALARERYETDRASYHTSAQLSAVPLPDTLCDADLVGLLEQFDARQVLHMTFGSVLERFGERLRAVLCMHEETYYAALEAHLSRHLAPFLGTGTRSGC